MSLICFIVDRIKVKKISYVSIFYQKEENKKISIGHFRIFYDKK